MSVLKRANTWDISESECESDSEIKPPVKHDKNNDTKTRGTEDVNQETIDKTTECVPLSSCLVPKTELIQDTLVLPRPAANRISTPVRRRRTKEEIESDRLNAEQRTVDKETLRQLKARAKEEKRQEQQSRKEAGERLKSLRPENCLKCLTVCIDPALLEYEGSDILLGTLSAFEWKSTIETQLLRNSITWTRNLPQGGDFIEEEQALVVISLSGFMDLVISVKQILQNDGEESGGDVFFKSLSEFLNHHDNKVVTVLAMGPHPNSRTPDWQRDMRIETLGSRLGMDNVNIEEVLVYLQLYRNVSVVFLECWQDITDHVCAVTKALSKRPFKQLTERADLPFCVDNSWAGGVRVERNGAGLVQVWNRQIQQLNRVSPAVSTAVVKAYPSPQLLLQAYTSSPTEEEKRGMLAAIAVKSGGKERRVGPDISARVYRSLTASNPELVLD